MRRARFHFGTLPRTASPSGDDYYREMDFLTTAYLDPGTGSVILQALVGGVAGIVVVAKMGGRRFLSFLPIIGKKYRQDFVPKADGEDHASDEDVDDSDDDSNQDSETDLAALLEDAADS